VKHAVRGVTGTPPTEFGKWTSSPH
jgi:hypothetical protein